MPDNIKQVEARLNEVENALLKRILRLEDAVKLHERDLARPLYTRRRQQVDLEDAEKLHERDLARPLYNPISK